MADSYEAMMKRLARRRQLYQDALAEVIEALKAEADALASKSSPTAPREPSKRRAKRDSKEARVCAAAAALMSEKGNGGQNLAVVVKAVHDSGIDASPGYVSAVLSRSSDFISKHRKWYLAKGNDESVQETVEAGTEDRRPSLLAPDF